MQADAAALEGAKNHPLAIRMGVIAGVSHNIVIGLVMGHFSVMIAYAQQRLGISGEQAALGMPLVLVGSSLMAPIAGVLIARHSVKLLLSIGALMTAGGFAVLALTQSFAFYLAAYGLLLGPALSLSGSIVPATLVTRWFSRNRGFALGVVHLPIVIAILPVALNWFAEHNGAVVSYLTMGIFPLVVLLPLTFLTIDHPPGGETLAPEPAAKRTSDGSFSVAQLLARPRFWAICLVAIASMTSSVLLGSLIVPIGVSWGFTPGESALIQSIMSAVAILGSLLFGLVADRIGGIWTLAVIAFDCAILWVLLLLQPPFVATALVVGLLGMHGSGAIPAISRAISDTFGAASFSRGFGLNTVIALPFMATAVIGAAGVYSATGSYSPALITMSGFFVVGILLALYAVRGGQVTGPGSSPSPA